MKIIFPLIPFLAGKKLGKEKNCSRGKNESCAENTPLHSSKFYMEIHYLNNIDLGML